MTRHADWYFDIVSPYAYLQFATFDRLPDALETTIKPVLFAGLLSAWDNMGPAEIPAKRRQTYRYCHWLARKRGIPFKTPPRHPFNPLAILRLAVVLDGDPAAVGTIFHHVWGLGNDGQDPQSLAALAARLGVAAYGASPTLGSQQGIEGLDGQPEHVLQGVAELALGILVVTTAFVRLQAAPATCRSPISRATADVELVERLLLAALRAPLGP